MHGKEWESGPGATWYNSQKLSAQAPICIIDYLNLIFIIKVNSHHKYEMEMKILTFDYEVTF